MNSNSVLINRTEIVQIHLDLLEEAVAQPASAKQAIRASISLRFLFDGALNRVAYDKAVDLRIAAPDLSTVPINQALLFACGGYVLDEHDIAPYYLYREPGPTSPHRAQFERDVTASPNQHKLAEYKLGEFTRQPCVAFVGKIFSREVVVRYVANKCGGAHHHDDTAKFGEIENCITDIGHTLEVRNGDISAIFLETLGTAWYLLNSPSISQLRET